MMNYWLIKSEPEVYSINDLHKDKKTIWEGVRNYQARNFMIDGMKPGDLAFFYHSNAEPPGIAGLVEILKVNQVDPTQFDKKSDYYDPKSTQESPRWKCIEVKFQKKFKNFLSLQELKKHNKISLMLLLKPGTRLSVQPVTKSEFEYILSLEK